MVKSAHESEHAGELTVRATEYATEAMARRVKKAIKSVGTAQTVAGRSGIPKGTLNGYATGRAMSFENAIAFAKATGVSLEWLATGEGPMRPGEAQETNVSEGFSLRQHGNMEALAAAYMGAVSTLAQAGRDTQHAPSIARMMALIYDDIIANEPAPKNR